MIDDGRRLGAVEDLREAHIPLSFSDTAAGHEVRMAALPNKCAF